METFLQKGDGVKTGSHWEISFEKAFFCLPRRLLAHVVLHLCPPDHNRIFRPNVCGTEVRTQPKYSTHAAWTEENSMMNFRQIWTGRRPLHRLGRSLPVHHRGLHSMFLHHKLLQSKVCVNTCCLLDFHTALICALSVSIHTQDQRR